MGQTHSDSVNDTLNRGTKLQQDILNIVNELTEQYETKYYLNPRFCQQIAIVYSNKLLQYSKLELRKVAYNLGLVVDDVALKDQICSAIIKHYHDRINLMAAIKESISHCSVRIFALTSGPRCEGAPEIFDKVACENKNKNKNSSKYKWIPQYIPGETDGTGDQARIELPDEELKENSLFYTRLNSMQTVYLTTLQKLLEILYDLKSKDKIISNEDLQQLTQRAEILIANMSTNCSQLYRLALSAPKINAAEQKMMIEHAQANANANQALENSTLGHSAT